MIQSCSQWQDSILRCSVMSESHQMQVFVHHSFGADISLQVWSSDYIGDLKNEIQLKLGFLGKEQ